MLGDIENPIIEEMKNHQLLSHEEALQQFMDYVGDGILLGHNADYDYNILDANLKRYLPQIDLRTKCSRGEKMPKKWDDIFPITSGINLIATGHVETVVLMSRKGD